MIRGRGNLLVLLRVYSQEPPHGEKRWVLRIERVT
jgi:hypothetical protein